jgi:hypothetical protein
MTDDKVKATRDPKIQSAKRNFTYQPGAVNLIPQLDGTGGFLLVRFDATTKIEDTIVDNYTVHVFVANATYDKKDPGPFAWQAPDEAGNWLVVDVPIGFAISNSDAIAAALQATTQHPDPPVIVHGKP